MTDDEIDELYSKLCDFFWRLDYPETPKDGTRHTSDVCRARANEILKIVGLYDAFAESAERHIATLSNEAKARLVAFVAPQRVRRSRRRR